MFFGRDVTLPGASSDIAILVEYPMGDETLRVVVEHRRYAGMIGLKQVEMFLDLARVAGADAAAMFSTTEYSDEAWRRADDDALDIALEVLKVDPTRDIQRDRASAFLVGSYKISLLPPFQMT
jgi:hypothetical protein